MQRKTNKGHSRIAVLLGSALALVAVLGGLQALNAAVTSEKQAILINLSPVYSDPDVRAGEISTTPAVGIDDCASANEGIIRRLSIQNTHASQDLCWYLVDAAGACGSSRDCDGSGTDDGNLVMPLSAVAPNVACDLRLCIVGSASQTSFHIASSEYPE